jgi:restriction endonuclease S subunit
MYKLSDIASIHSGKLFKNGVKDEKEGTPVVQIRDVAEGKSINWEQVARVKLERAPRHYLKNGDVVFLTKGIENHAVEIDGLKEEAIATSHFFYIRPKERIDSQFLALQLNSIRTKSYFRSCYKSGRKKHITKGDLLDTDINVPTMREQKEILRVERVLAKQSDLIISILEGNALLVESLLNNDDIDKALEPLIEDLELYREVLLSPEKLISLLSECSLRANQVVMKRRHEML